MYEIHRRSAVSKYSHQPISPQTTMSWLNLQRPQLFLKYGGGGVWTKKSPKCFFLIIHLHKLAGVQVYKKCPNDMDDENNENTLQL